MDEGIDITNIVNTKRRAQKANKLEQLILKLVQDLNTAANKQGVGQIFDKMRAAIDRMKKTGLRFYGSSDKPWPDMMQDFQSQSFDGQVTPHMPLLVALTAVGLDFDTIFSSSKPWYIVLMLFAVVHRIPSADVTTLGQQLVEEDVWDKRMPFEPQSFTSLTQTQAASVLQSSIAVDKHESDDENFDDDDDSMLLDSAAQAMNQIGILCGKALIISAEKQAIIFELLQACAQYMTAWHMLSDAIQTGPIKSARTAGENSNYTYVQLSVSSLGMLRHGTMLMFEKTLKNDSGEFGNWKLSSKVSDINFYLTHIEDISLGMSTASNLLQLNSKCGTPDEVQQIFSWLYHHDPENASDKPPACLSDSIEQSKRFECISEINASQRFSIKGKINSDLMDCLQKQLEEDRDDRGKKSLDSFLKLFTEKPNQGMILTFKLTLAGPRDESGLPDYSASDISKFPYRTVVYVDDDYNEYALYPEIALETDAIFRYENTVSPAINFSKLHLGYTEAGYEWEPTLRERLGRPITRKDLKQYLNHEKKRYEHAMNLQKSDDVSSSEVANSDFSDSSSDEQEIYDRVLIVGQQNSLTQRMIGYFNGLRIVPMVAPQEAGETIAYVMKQGFDQAGTSKWSKRKANGIYTKRSVLGTYDKLLKMTEGAVDKRLGSVEKFEGGFPRAYDHFEGKIP